MKTNRGKPTGGARPGPGQHTGPSHIVSRFHIRMKLAEALNGVLVSEFCGAVQRDVAAVACKQAKVRGGKLISRLKRHAAEGHVQFSDAPRALTSTCPLWIKRRHIRARPSCAAQWSGVSPHC